MSSVPYGFRDLFLVPPLSFTTTTFSRPKPHDQRDRNDTDANDKKASEDRINVVVVKVAVTSLKDVYGMQ